MCAGRVILDCEGNSEFICSRARESIATVIGLIGEKFRECREIFGKIRIAADWSRYCNIVLIREYYD